MYLIILSFCSRYTSLKFVSDADEVAVTNFKFVSDADEVAVTNFNRWLHDNYAVTIIILSN
jgi:hypothetical protein